MILPSGKVQVIAEFEPSAAFGKLHPGQHAVLRLQGFPWAQYGTISARVSKVAGEIRDGKVRVELAVVNIPGSRIPIQHGLPGSVEVEVERITPAALILRLAGDMAGTH
jgi:membrane fusion protein (multidrug efflux system)